MTSLPRYSLYYSVRSPFARRVRVALQRLTVDYEPREMNVFEPSPEFLATNPLALVPALVVNDRGSAPFVISDSATILEYLHENYGERIWPADLPTRARVRAASTLAEGLMTECVRWFLETQRPEPSAEAMGESLENLDRTLGAIAGTALRAQPWKVSDFQLTQAGYDLVIALEYLRLRLKGVEWETKYPELAKFLDGHRVRQDLAPTAPAPLPL